MEEQKPPGPIYLGDYEVLSKIGKGSFGMLFLVKNTKNDEIFAAKIEPKNKIPSTLQFEIKVLRILQHSEYFPHLYSFGSTEEYNYFIMNLLGLSLKSIQEQVPNNALSLSSVARLAKHTLLAIQTMHSSGILHRDIKPGNILVTNRVDYPICLIDFGMARVYIDIKTGKHQKPRDSIGFRGTAIYASTHAHMNKELSRRDDMISWYYVIVDLLTGALPWKYLMNSDDIFHLKRTIDVSSLVRESAPELADCWPLVSNLEYYDKPEYEKILGLIDDLIKRENIKDDDPYDWSAIEDETEENKSMPENCMLQ